MATSNIKAPTATVVRQTFTQNLSASVWYGTATINIAKEGYIPIAVSPSVNQTRYHCQLAGFTNTTATVNVADYSTSGMNVTVTVVVTYVKE